MVRRANETERNGKKRHNGNGDKTAQVWLIQKDQAQIDSCHNGGSHKRGEEDAEHPAERIEPI